MNRHYNVITVGESTIDAFMSIHDVSHACRIDHEHNDICFKFGEKIDVDRYDFCIGGNATNVAVGISRLGLKATLCSETGDDEFSIKIRNCLAQEHIERLLVTQTKGASNFAVIINFKGDRTIFVQDVEREHDFQLTDVTADYVYLTSLGNEWRKPYAKVLEFIEEYGGLLAFNPAPRQLNEGKDIVHKVLKKTHVLFVNKEEAERILTDKVTDKRDKTYIQELMAKLQKLGPKTIVVTDGKKGSYAMDDKGTFFWHGINDGPLVERTGAGDAFASGFLAAYLQGLSMPKAMEWGSWNATSVVSKVGAQAGLLTKDGMEEKVK